MESISIESTTQEMMLRGFNTDRWGGEVVSPCPSVEPAGVGEDL